MRLAEELRQRGEAMSMSGMNVGGGRSGLVPPPGGMQPPPSLLQQPPSSQAPGLLYPPPGAEMKNEGRVRLTCVMCCCK